MEPISTPSGFVDQPNPSPPKLAILILILIALIVTVVLVIKKVTPQIQPISKEASQSSSIVSEHPELFYATLQYNPTSQTMTQLTSGKANGDIPHLFGEQPNISPSRFTYKIEIVTDKNVLVQSGWESISKELIQTPDGNLEFKVVTIYEPNAVIRVSLPDGNIIWTGKIE